MTLPDFSVLLLAWDDADPGVAVLGGSALPPTLPLVYELAAHHPVVALYPHLPAAPAEPTEPATPASAASAAAATPIAAPAWPEPGIIPDPLDVATDGPGVRLLPAAQPVGPARRGASAAPALAVSSRLVGLDDLLPPTQAALASAHQLAPAPGAVPPAGTAWLASSPPPTPAPGRSQWPTPPGPPDSWHAPAAPYAGASETAGTPAAGAAKTVLTAALQANQPVWSARSTSAVDTPAGPRHPDAQLLPPPPPRPPAAPELPSAFEETVAEMGAAEARDLDASEDDLTLDAAVPATTAPGTAVPQAAALAETAVSSAASTAPEAAPVPTAAQAAGPGLRPRQPQLDGLNFRMIQYARRAMQLVAGHGEFGVIYAPGWPAWLAALEIRNRTGRPLVLYAAALASDTAAPAERGWLLGIERMALRRARLVLVPDAGMQQLLHQRHGADLGEVRIVPAADETALQLVLAEVALG